MPDGCEQCHDLGYTTFPGGRWAQAQLCDACSVPCRKCADDERIIARGDDGKTWVAACSCVAARRRIAQFNLAHLPAAYHAKTVEDFEATTKDQRAVKSRILGFQTRGQAGDSGVLVVGDPGVGKTHLMCGILRFLILERGLDARYV
ncbi:MAG: DNA replication protein DnaC, partial [Myxococcota bacterium]